MQEPFSICSEKVKTMKLAVITAYSTLKKYPIRKRANSETIG